MPGHGVANPGSLIGFVFLFLLLFNFNMANAPFQIHSISLYSRGGCFWGHVVLSQHVSMPRPMRRLAQAFHSATSLAISSERAAARLDIGLVIARPLSLVRWSWSRRWVGFWLECAAIARFARLVLLAAGLLACFALCCASAWFFLVTTRHPFWFVFVPAEGNRFALGTGGIRWSLLVGGLGPVLSIPKLCFKPFRSFLSPT